MAKTLREQLIGTWKLVTYKEVPVDGTPAFFPLSEEPQGTIMYAPDGYMSAQLEKPGRPEFVGGDRFKGTPEEYAEEAVGYVAYSGPFHIDEEKQHLMHSMFVSLFPNWIGQTQNRVVKIEGNMLYLSTDAPILSGGTQVNSVLSWRRAEAN